MLTQSAENRVPQPGVYIANYDSLFHFINETGLEMAQLHADHMDQDFDFSSIEADLSYTRFVNSPLKSEQSYLSFNRSTLPVSPASYAVKSIMNYSDNLSSVEKYVDDDKLSGIACVLSEMGYNVRSRMSIDTPSFLRGASRSLQLNDVQTASRFGILFSQYGRDSSKWGISTELTQKDGMYLHIYSDKLMRKQFDHYLRCYADFIAAFHVMNGCDLPDYHIDFKTPKTKTKVIMY